MNPYFQSNETVCEKLPGVSSEIRLGGGEGYQEFGGCKMSFDFCDKTNTFVAYSSLFSNSNPSFSL